MALSAGYKIGNANGLYVIRKAGSNRAGSNRAGFIKFDD